jgi:hypothetical protein
MAVSGLGRSSKGDTASWLDEPKQRRGELIETARPGHAVLVLTPQVPQPEKPRAQTQSLRQYVRSVLRRRHADYSRKKAVGLLVDEDAQECTLDSCERRRIIVEYGEGAKTFEAVEVRVKFGHERRTDCRFSPPRIFAPRDCLETSGSDIHTRLGECQDAGGDLKVKGTWARGPLVGEIVTTNVIKKEVRSEALVFVAQVKQKPHE